ncbi:MAG: redoxin domain-containing protein [Thaumarchaeota archaeon]|nr:redoxin domain-containing protein [Nitrososphaerota archaeon]
MKKIEKLLLLVSTMTVFTTSYAYADNMKMNDSMMPGNMTNGMMNSQVMDSPLQQIKHGILAHDVKCNTGFTLILKLDDGSPACVKSSTVNILVMRGWAMSEDSTMKTINQNMTGMQDMANHTMTNETMKEDKEMAINNMENKSMTGAMPENNMKTPNDSQQMYQSSMGESKYPDAPALVGISDYINTTPEKLAQEMKGKIIVYDFWTFNCINCIHTLPHVVDLSNKYLGKDVLVIGIHSPETFFEKDPNNVKDAIHRYNIQYPVVIDNEFQTWNAFGNHYWPHVYISDSHGKIRYDHIGEGAYDEIDKTVADLLLEQDS